MGRVSKEIGKLHAAATTEAEHITLLEAHRNLVAVGPHAYDAETFAKLLPITRSEYLFFLNKEATEGGVLNPVLLERVTAREVEAGRLEPDSEFRQLAAAGALLGDSSEFTAHACRNGTWLFVGMAVAAIIVWGARAAGVTVSPVWLIPAGLLAGWVMNEREHKSIKARIAAARAM